MPAPKTRERFSKAKRQKFLEHMRSGLRRGAAAEELGLTRREVLEYIESHDDFEKDVLDAEGEATEHVEEALYQAAISGHVGACRVWLELRSDRANEVNMLDDADIDDPEMAKLMAEIEG